MQRLALIAALWSLFLGCGQAPHAVAPPQSAPAQQFQRVRAPAVAGAFYPAEKEALLTAVDGYLSAAPKAPLGRVRAVICPHAGYAYSGKTAAHGYKQVQGGDYTTVLVLAASHYAEFEGVALSDHDAVETPLARTAVGPLAQKLNAYKPFRVNPPCRRLNRPPWAGALPPGETPTPITWEHSIEVQFPFIERALPNAQIVPAVCGDADPQQIAAALSEVLDEHTLLVGSTDLSHYYPYDQAKALDASCIHAICSLDIAAMKDQEACGKTPVLVILHLAKQKGWKARLLDQCNSGDTAGDKSRVVGYAAVAFCEDGPVAAAPAAEAKTVLSADQKRLLLRLARESLERAVRGESPPLLAASQIGPPLGERRACFVTLKKAGQLRGCIGSILPEEPLHEAVISRARAAAINDHRFQPVQTAELAQIDVEVSVLTLPQPLSFSSPDDLLAKLRPKVDGLILNLGGAQATFLPQVWEELPDKADFLAHLSQKAGRAPDAWRQPGVEAQVYQVVAFKEKE